MFEPKHDYLANACKVTGKQRGSAMIEYTIVLLLLVIVLLAHDEAVDVIHQLADAVRDTYTSLVYALSISWI